MSKSFQKIFHKYSIIPPSFREGIARVLDIGGTLTPKVVIKKNYRKDDVEAIRSDWQNVGHDLSSSISKYQYLHFDCSHR